MNQQMEWNNKLLYHLSQFRISIPTSPPPLQNSSVMVKKFVLYRLYIIISEIQRKSTEKSVGSSLVVFRWIWEWKYLLFPEINLNKKLFNEKITNSTEFYNFIKGECELIYNVYSFTISWLNFFSIYSTSTYIQNIAFLINKSHIC